MATTTWSIDPTHSEVMFQIKHLVISTVRVQFKTYNGLLEAAGDDFSGAKATFEASIDSISTNNADRDGHLKSPDFFDAANFPTLNFESTSFENKGGNDYKITGNFTIKGVTKEVTLDAEFGGIMTDPYGNVKAGFEITGKINRKDFGLTWNAALETGGVLVGEEVKLVAEIQLIKQ
jgi:polyisoprenoid-binding protein YceI